MKYKLTGLFVFLALLITMLVFNFSKVKKKLSDQEGQVSEVSKEQTINEIRNRFISAKLVDYAAKTVSINQIDFTNKKIIYIHLWASWCGPCLNEIPELIHYAKKHNDEVKFFLISLDDSKEDLEKFLKSFPEMNDPMFVKIWDQDKSFSKFFDVDRLPMTVVLDLIENRAKSVRSVIDWKSL